jgi:hypothetical protein
VLVQTELRRRVRVPLLQMHQTAGLNDRALVLLLVGAAPMWPYSSGWGYYPSGGVGALLIILLILMFAGFL